VWIGLFGLVDLPAQDEHGSFLLKEELNVSLIESQKLVRLLIFILLSHLKLRLERLLWTHLISSLSSETFLSLSLEVLCKNTWTECVISYHTWNKLILIFRHIEVYFGGKRFIRVGGVDTRFIEEKTWRICVVKVHVHCSWCFSVDFEIIIRLRLRKSHLTSRLTVKYASTKHLKWLFIHFYRKCSILSQKSLFTFFCIS
jgi:hypothetical protein